MIRKGQILEYLGEAALDLPRLLQDALAANDRVKTLFTVLQAARSHADSPHALPADLPTDQQHAQIHDPEFGMVVRGSWREDGDRYHIPAIGDVFEGIIDGIETMIRPFAAAEVDERTSFEERLNAMHDHTGRFNGSTINGATIDWITSVGRDGTDTPHALVMELHRGLNELQAAMAQETVDGAHVYGLESSDYPCVRAFMAGVNRTSQLKFDHPGLSTTATRSNAGLVVQNDIGTTDAHVFVVTVSHDTASFTYSDVHLRRLEFFQRMLKRFDIDWEGPQTGQSDALAGGDPFYLTRGRFVSSDRDAMYDFLEFLASRLVFLIDWNRARKRLRPFLRKKSAIALLDWAATEEVGHRAFLQVDGDQMVLDAVAASTPGRPTRQRLDKTLGEATTFDLLKNVFRTATTGLLEDRSERLIRDEVRAELLTTFETVQESLLDLAYDQSALIADLADRLRSGVYHAKSQSDPQELANRSRRAKDLETRADEIVMEARGILQGTRSSATYTKLFSQIDDVADGLEESIFLLTLLPHVKHDPDLYEPLVRLADLTVRGARAFVSCVESARHVHRGASRDHTQDFLEAADRVVTVEHDADGAHRAVIAELYRSAGEFRQLRLFEAVAGALETATDALTRCVFTLRDVVLSDLATGGTRS